MPICSVFCCNKRSGTSSLQKDGVTFHILIILLALLVGVLYCLHLLVKDYQALTAGRLLRYLFKRDISSQNYSKPNVRWKNIIRFDGLQCARAFYCGLGARPPDNEIQRGFIFMLTLAPSLEDFPARQEFLKAYSLGRQSGEDKCREEYPLCIFKPSLLFEMVQFLLKNPYPEPEEPDLS